MRCFYAFSRLCNASMLLVGCAMLLVGCAILLVGCAMVLVSCAMTNDEVTWPLSCDFTWVQCYATSVVHFYSCFNSALPTNAPSLTFLFPFQDYCKDTWVVRNRHSTHALDYTSLRFLQMAIVLDFDTLTMQLLPYPRLVWPSMWVLLLRLHLYVY